METAIEAKTDAFLLTSDGPWKTHEIGSIDMLKVEGLNL